MSNEERVFCVYVVQGYYGALHGWEDVTEADTLAEAQGYLKDYRANEAVPFRLKKRKITEEDAI